MLSHFLSFHKYPRHKTMFNPITAYGPNRFGKTNLRSRGHRVKKLCYPKRFLNITGGLDDNGPDSVGGPLPAREQNRFFRQAEGFSDYINTYHILFRFRPFGNFRRWFKQRKFSVIG